MPDDRDSLRAADADREFVAERLRSALNEGRLTLTEYDDRLQETYSARTYGDLKGLLADLPAVAPAERSQVVPSAAPSSAVASTGHTRQWVAGMWSSWLSVSIILTAIWALSGGGDFWPVWVIGIWGAYLAAQTIGGLAKGEPKRAAERQRVRRIEREQRRSAERERRLRDGEPLDPDPINPDKQRKDYF